MTELRQRRPRICEPKYLEWLRKQKCACGCGRQPPSDAAHLRVGNLIYGKEFTGACKPDDQWAMPLNRSCHMRQHAFGSEMEWWAVHSVPNPWVRALRYYSAWFAQAARKPARASSASKPRKAKTKPKANRKPPGGHRWASKPFPKRKFRT